MTDKTQEIEEFRKLIDLYHGDIAVFAKQVFNSDLTPKQREFCEAFRTKRTITFRGGVGFGKTHAEAIVTWWALICHDQVQVSIFGPSEPNLKGGIWKELQILHARMHPMFKDAYEVQATRISRKVNPASCFADMRLASGDRPDNARGIHAQNNFVLVDEASGVDDEVLQVLLNILTDPNGKLVLVSNPSKASGFFWRTHCDPEIRDEWTQVHGKMADSPHFNPASFEQLAKNYGGPTSRQFRVMVEGEFPLHDLEGLINRDMLDAAVNNDEFEPSPSVPVVYGLDVAGKGSDASVLCIRHDSKVLEFKEFRGLDAVQLGEKISQIYHMTPKPMRPAIIAVDATGFGSAYCDVLQAHGLPVYRCNFASTPTRNPQKYSRMRDQIWCEMRDWIHSEAVSIPNEPLLIEDLANTQYEDGTGRIKVEDKKSMRKRLGRSTDYGDSLALTFAVSRSRYASKHAWNKPIAYDNLQTFE